MDLKIVRRKRLFNTMKNEVQKCSSFKEVYKLLLKRFSLEELECIFACIDGVGVEKAKNTLSFLHSELRKEKKNILASLIAESELK